MRVLVLTHPVPDYGAAFLMEGLCNVIGQENVYTYPAKKSYEGGYDTAEWTPWQPFQAGPFPWWTIRTLGHVDHKREALRDRFFDYVILESIRRKAIVAFRELEADIRASNTPVLVHDGEDSFGFSKQTKELIVEIQPLAVMKRELPIECAGIPSNSKIIPFPFSCPQSIFDWPVEDMPMENSPYDVCLAQGITHNDRRLAAISISSLATEGYSVSLRNEPKVTPICKDRLPFTDYLDELGASKTGVAVRGGGFDTCRQWEVAALTVLVRDRLDIVIPHDFIDGKDAFLFSSPTTCHFAVRKALSDRSRLSDIWKAGREKLKAFHTCSQRVKTLFEQLL